MQVPRRIPKRALICHSLLGIGKGLWFTEKSYVYTSYIVCVYMCVHVSVGQMGTYVLSTK